MSISHLVRLTLLGLDKNFSKTNKKAYEKAKQEGIKIGQKIGYKHSYTNRKNNWAVLVKCWNCHKPMYVTSKSKVYIKKIDQIEGSTT